tara:strand:- start:626 stop:832 length:207 start_codon:yes stop_codon:yes gene_type:complete
LPDINKTFYDMINQEDWSEDVFTGIEEDTSIVMKNYITIPTPHPHFFINLTFEYEYNPQLGDDLFGEI